MKYPFKFSETFIADMADINSVEIVEKTVLNIGFKVSGDIAKIKYDTPEHCKATFDSFCDIAKRRCAVKMSVGCLESV